MPTSIQDQREVQLKEGNFIFQANFKTQVDIEALRDMPNKFDICQQGIDALNDLFYEVTPEQKEGVLTQKAIWENMLERILDMRVFNAGSSYTNLANKLLPVRVSLPQDKQYYPIDPLFPKDPSNPFKETKRFARELLDIVAAIKTMREEKLFHHKDFYIYPKKEAFVLTDTDEGKRRIAIGLHSIAPGNVDESLSSEELSIEAIKDLISSRWDKREFKKVLKAKSLNAIFQLLKHISQDVPPLKMFALKTASAAIYTGIIFLIFSGLMYLTGYTPWNKAQLEKLSIYSLGENGKEKIKLATEITKIKGTKQESVSNIRILLESDKEKSENIYQIVGTFRSPFRLKTMAGLGVFKLLNLSTQLDKVYNLNFNQSLEQEGFKVDPDLKILEVIPAFSNDTLRFKTSHDFGRERVKILPVQDNAKEEGKKEKAGPNIQLELIVEKPAWKLATNNPEIAFQEAEQKKRYVETRTIDIFAGPKKIDAKLDSYFSINYDKLGVPLEIHYLDPKGKTIAKIKFNEFEGGNLKTAPELYSIRTTGSNRPRYPDEYDNRQDYNNNNNNNNNDNDYRGIRREVLPRVKNIDTFWLKRNDGIAQIALTQGVISKEQLIEVQNKWQDIPGKEIGKLLIEKRYITKQEYKKFLAILATSKEKLYKKVIKDVYYRLPKFPKDVNAIKIKVLSRNLPSEKIEGNLHIAVPGIRETLSIPITFQAKQQIEFDPGKMEDIRKEVTALAYPIKLTKKVWGKVEKFNYYKLYNYTFELDVPKATPHFKGFPACTLGLQLKQDPNTIFFYNPVDGFTYKISEYRNVGGKKYFKPNPKSYKKAETEFFEYNKATPLAFKLKGAIAETTSQLYVMILTEKNVEKSNLILRFKDKLSAKLPITARSEEALRLVNWKNTVMGQGLRRYTSKDWTESVAVKGPLGNARYQSIIFSGEEADDDVSDEVYVHIENPELVNILYQTVDGDWFANVKTNIEGVKQLDKKSNQLSIKKFGEGTERKEYFRAEVEQIGKIKKYLIVPGNGVQPGQKEQKTKIEFYHPEKNMTRSLKVAVSCAKSKKVDWKVKFDDKSKNFNIEIVNYPDNHADIKQLVKELEFFTTCASVYLLHNQYHNPIESNEEDQKWAQTVRWSLESAGFELPSDPPSILGRLGETIKLAIKIKNEEGIKKAYEIAKESLLLSWSSQAESLINYHLKLDQMKDALNNKKSIQNKNFTFEIKTEPQRELPPLVNEPKRFVSIKLSIPYDKLVFDKNTPDIVQLREAYYYNIPRNFKASTKVNEILQKVFPYPKNFPVQDQKIGQTKISVSKTFYENLLQYSLWEQRLEEFRKEKSSFWIAMQAVTADIAGIDGYINVKEVNNIAQIIQDKLRTYFLSPIEIHRVFWSELKDKKRGDKTNRQIIGKSAKEGILRFVDRSMMPQFEEESNKAWYTKFTIRLDRRMVGRCPYHKWVYMKSYRSNKDGFESEPVKLRIFKREGLSLAPYPGQQYNVDIRRSPSDSTKFVTVEGINLFQDWFTHKIKQIKDKKKKELKIKLYYEESGMEKELKSPGLGGPVILDFQAHPSSIVLYQVSGYHISPDRIREIVRKKEFTIKTTRGETKWNFTFIFDNGPILVPFAFKIKKRTDDIKSFSVHILNWKPDSPPSQEERQLETFSKNYSFEFLYINAKTRLPMSKFFPYNDLEEICRDYDQRRMSSNRMVDFLKKMFEFSSQLQEATKFKWNNDLTAFYKENKDQNQMFQYSYDNNHQLKITVPALFQKPEGFKGEGHPVLKAPPGHRMAVIWKIIRPNGSPIYVMEKEFFPNTEPVFSKE